MPPPNTNKKKIPCHLAHQSHFVPGWAQFAPGHRSLNRQGWGGKCSWNGFMMGRAGHTAFSWGSWPREAAELTPFGGPTLGSVSPAGPHPAPEPAGLGSGRPGGVAGPTPTGTGAPPGCAPLYIAASVVFPKADWVTTPPAYSLPELSIRQSPAAPSPSSQGPALSLPASCQKHPPQLNYHVPR